MELIELEELKKLLKKFRKTYASTMQEVDDITQIAKNIDQIVEEKAYIQI